MSDIATRLRQCAADIRRTPVRLDTWIPLQQEAADTIDALRAEVDAFREDAANYYRIAKEADAQQAALRARVADGDVVRGDLQTVADVLRDYEGETVWQQAQAAVARVAELEARLKTPYCACSWDANDNVVGLCGAHAAKVETLRDAVLNDRGFLAEAGMTSDQTNAVLATIDALWPTLFSDGLPANKPASLPEVPK